MQPNARLMVLALIACLAGCSKPLAPVDRSSAAAHGAALSRSREEFAARPEYRVRLRFVGSVVSLDAAYLPRVDRNAVFYVYGHEDYEEVPVVYRDTIPAYSVLQRIEWRRVRQAAAGTAVTRERSEAAAESEWIADETMREEPRVFAPGIHVLRLEAPARAGGGTVTVYFLAGFRPTSWWAGPDPDLWPRSSDGDGRAVDVTHWNSFATSSPWPPDGRGYFGPDSFRTVPSQRRPVHGDIERRTFYEIYGNRIYARAEGDSVHLNSWVVLVNGGYDRDSPYVPLVDASDPALPPGFAGNSELYSVLLPQGLIGSPIGFRSRVTVRTAGGILVSPAYTSAYPNFIPTSVFRDPRIAGYWRMQLPGRAYAMVRAEDSHGLLGPSLLSPEALADRVDSGAGTPEDRVQRRSILTFHVRPAAVPETGVGAMAGGERLRSRSTSR